MLQPEEQFAPIERPTLPGSPYVPSQGGWRRAAETGVAFSTAMTATLGNALVSTNVPNVAGSLGEYVSVAAILPAMFVAMNATGNLAIIKSRIQWGIPAVTHTVLAVYALAAFLQLMFPTFAFALLVRAASGLAAAALITTTVFYLLQVFPPKIRPAALVVGVGLTQLGLPLARLFPVEWLTQHQCQPLHLIEVALPLTVLALMKLFPLPPSDRSKAFEPLDMLTIALLVPAVLLICTVLGAGRGYWWTDTPRLGWALAAAIPLLAGAILVEINRRRPLLHMEWISSATILRFAAVALLMRLALAEQTYGAVGLLTSSGLNNEQLRTLFLIVLAAMLVGLATAVLTLHPKRLRLQTIAAALSIAIGAWLDSHTTNLTRPPELYLSQALIGFGTTLFIGPTLAFGFIRMLQRGPAYFVSLVVLFSSTQNIGSIAGAALLGSYQVIATRAHAFALSDHLTAADPQVIARIQSGTHLLAGTLTDPAQQASQGAALLGQAQSREATVLAFNDVFGFVALLAFGTALYVSATVVCDLLRSRRLVPGGSGA